MLEAAPHPGFALPGLLGPGRVEIVDDERGIGGRIASRLVGVGVDAHVVEQVSADASGVIFAKGLLASASQEEAIAVQRAALGAARVLARRPPGDRVLVTLQDTGGDFGVSGRAGERAWSGGLPGLVKTAAAEWPDAAVKAIDVACSDVSLDEVADRVVRELLLGGRDVEVALGPDGHRAILRHRRAAYRPIRPDAARMRPGAVLVVSGGARGVTATSIAALCKVRPRLALLGRTELADEPIEVRGAVTDADIRRALLARATAAGVVVPPKQLAGEAKVILDCREIRANIAALERAGATVSYRPVDVRSAEAVRACVDAIRGEWGPIHGIIHGAGVLADALLANQTDEQFNRVFGTKVDGLRHLLSATASDPIELLVFFSSVAGRFGNSAQAVYSMANGVLSSVAANERARRPGCLVRSIAWGPWAGGMVTPGLARIFEKAGVQLIALDAGAQALAREVASDDGSSEVVLMNGVAPLTARPIHGGRSWGGRVDAEEGFEVLVNAATYPQLKGHRIIGAPVVPAVLVIEWFLRAAAICFPALVVRACRDVRVLRGIAVEAFEQRGVRLIVRARVLESTADGARLELRLMDDRERPRYIATVEMGASAATPPPDPLPDAPRSGEGSTWTIDQVYSEVLFHRPPFASIQSLDRVFDDSASGELAGLRTAGWPDADWCSDPALIDGGLQLACVWGRHVLGGVPLPTSVGAFDLYRAGPVDSPVRCVLLGRRAGQRKVIVELAYLTATGDLLATIRNLEMHLPLVVDGNAAPALDHASTVAGGIPSANGAA